MTKVSVQPLHSRVTAAGVVHGNLSIHKPLDGWVTLYIKLLGQVGLLGGINLKDGRRQGGIMMCFCGGGGGGGMCVGGVGVGG